MKITDEVGNRYALCHAVFDEELYEQFPYCTLSTGQFFLKAAILNPDYQDPISNYYLNFLNSFNNSLWYRKGKICMKNENEMKMPMDVRAIIAGHTPQNGRINTDYIHNVPVIYIDNSRNKEDMLGLQITPNGECRQINLRAENVRNSDSWEFGQY